MSDTMKRNQIRKPRNDSLGFGVKIDPTQEFALRKSLSGSRVNKISAVMAVLMGNQPKGLQCNFNNKLCRLCSVRDIDSAKHIIFTCDSLREHRDI